MAGLGLGSLKSALLKPGRSRTAFTAQYPFAIREPRTKKPPHDARFLSAEAAGGVMRYTYRLAVRTSSESRLTHGAGLCYTAGIDR